jgi:hypothetical protein
MKYNRESSDRNVLHSTCLGDPETQISVHGGNVELLETIMAKLGHTHVDVLKIDIEGASLMCVCVIVLLCLYVNMFRVCA